METVMAFVIGIFFSIGTYLILTKSLLRIILGTSIIGHGALLLLLTMGGLKQGEAPLLGMGAMAYADPLPQALILTAIVINFGTTAFFLVLAYRAYQEFKSDDMKKLRGPEHE